MTVERSSGASRFEALLAGASDRAHNQPLLERGDWLVAPTLGAIVPGWLLALPRRHVLSFRDWAGSGGQSAQSVLNNIRLHLRLEPDEIIWFEHGPAETGTVVGCGLDHAHLHILIRPPFGFQAFVDHARASGNLSWRESSAVGSYSALAGTASYCVAGSGDRAIIASHVEAAGPQFFRRVVASLRGDPMKWDYRAFAQLDNIDKTINIFKYLESAARRVR